MGGGITIQFKNLEDKEDFLSSFDNSEDSYITFKFEIKENEIEDITVSYLNFNFEDYCDKNSVNFGYSFGGCCDFFCYLLAYEVAEKYDVKLYWDSLLGYKDKKDFFKKEHCASLKFWKINKNEQGEDIPIVDKNILKRIKELEDMEEALRNKVCPGFFENNKFKKYLWKE